MEKLNGSVFIPWLAAVAMAALLAGSCTAEPTPTASRTPAPATAGAPAINPGKVTWLVGGFGNERFDYSLATGGSNEPHAWVMHAFLVSYDIIGGRKVFSPGIASKWGVSGNGLTWTFTIRKGVKFHDGTELTPADVVWTFQHAFGPQAGSYVVSGVGPTWARLIDRIEQTGTDEVSVTTKTPIADFLVNISEIHVNWMGAIMPKRATFHDVKEEETYDRNPIGAGAMKLVKHVAADSMTFERFADYYQQPKYGFPTDRRVKFTSLDLRLIPDDATRAAALQAGQADIALVTLQARKQVEARGGRLVAGREASIIDGVTGGCWKPEFSCHDKRVRQALAYAIDKELIRDRLYGADIMGIKGWAWVTPSAIGYTPGLDPFPFDPNKARQLLADAGYPGGKGFGKLVVNTWQSQVVPLLPESAQLAAQMWRTELGLDVEVKLGDQVGFLAAQRAGKFYGQILWRDYSGRLDPGSITLAYYGSPKRLDNVHDDPELWAMVNAALAVVDPVEREKALASLFIRLRDEEYDLAIGYTNFVYGVGPRILTWEPVPQVTYVSGLETVTLK